jgi:hypothetical protein
MPAKLSPRVMRLRAFYAQLKQPGGVRQAGGVRHVANQLRDLGYKAGQTSFYQGRQRLSVLNRPDTHMFNEPKSDSTFMIPQGKVNKQSLRENIARIRRKFRQSRNTPSQ